MAAQITEEMYLRMEREAIVEYDGGESRETAEAVARREAEQRGMERDTQ